ncbi:nuclear transport factor 2 family protein [uncultured Tateyamaria sp.]|uniref:nuclear transport factor 2 family protein n=1 Tax=uncultured Tateyamaria sp. TaxID=455651 RepID=UPI00261AE9FB|nr:nuclear transport factor 2 family protein [uncultured Tateyamaria sp.]
MDYDAFAIEWEAAWNAHDLDRILSHYAEDVTFRSQKAMRLVGHGELRGKAALGAYWSRALELQPNLSFIVVNVFHGHGMMVLTYRNHRNALAAETLRFGADGLVVSASACHVPAR